MRVVVAGEKGVRPKSGETTREEGGGVRLHGYNSGDFGRGLGGGKRTPSSFREEAIGGRRIPA